MKLRAYHFSLTPSGTQETPYSPASPQGESPFDYTLFCDALDSPQQDCPKASLEQETLSQLSERFLTDFLSQSHGQETPQELLPKALEYCHEQLLRYCEHRHKQVAVSAAIVALPTTTPSAPVWAACVGDCRLYTMDAKGAHLACYDSMNSIPQSGLQASQRFQELKNALGLGASLNCQPRRLDSKTFSRFVIASYGAYDGLDSQSLLDLGLHPHDPKKGAGATLSRFTHQGHRISLTAASYGSVEENITAIPLPTSSPSPSQNPNRRKAAITLSAAACLLAIPLTLWNASPTSYQPTSSQHSLALSPQTLHQLESELKDSQQALSSQKLAVTQMREELSSKSEALSTLQNQLDSVLAGDNQSLFQEMTRQLAEKGRVIEDLQVSLQSQQHQASQLRERISLLESDDSTLNQLNGKLAEQEIAISFLEQQKNDLLSDKRLAQEAIQALKEEVTELSFHNQDYRNQEKKVHSLIDENRSLSNRLASSENELKAAQDSLQGKRSSPGSSSRSNQRSIAQEVNHLQETLRIKENKITFLEQNLTLLDDLKRQLDNRETSFQQLAAEHEKLQYQAGQAQAQLEFYEVNQSHLTEVQHELEESRQQVSDLIDELDSLRSGSSSDTVELSTYRSLERELTKVKQDLQEKELHIHNLEKTLHAESDQHIHLQQQLSTFSTADNRWRQQLELLQEDYDAQAEALDHLQAELQRNQRENQALVAQIQENSQGTAKQPTNSLIKECGELRQIVQQQRQLLANFQSNQKEHQEENSSLLRQMDEMALSQRELEKEIALLQSDLQGHTLQRSQSEAQSKKTLQLSQELASAQVAYREEQIHARELAEELANLRDQADFLEEQLVDNAHYEEIYRKEHERSRELEFKLQALSDQLEEQQTASEQLSSLQQALARSEEDVLKAKRDSINSLKEQESSTKTIEALHEELVQLRGQLHTSQSEQLELQEQMASKESEVIDLEQRLAHQASQAQALARTAYKLEERMASIKDLEERYHAERRLRIQKEQKFAALAQTLKEHRQALVQAEQTKRQTERELAEVRTSPRSPLARSLGKRHKVASGETLTEISMKHYGTPNRWNDIYEANLDILPSPERVQPGDNLVIPR